MSRSQGVFAGVVVLALVWTGWLAYMAQTVAKPFVVSAPQLYSATLVVVAQVTVQGETAQARIIKTFKDDMKAVRPTPPTIQVQWSSSFPVSTEQPMLLALIRSPLANDASVYEVAPIPRLDMSQVYVKPYPYTDSVRIQIERILGAQ